MQVMSCQSGEHQQNRRELCGIRSIKIVRVVGAIKSFGAGDSRMDHGQFPLAVVFRSRCCEGHEGKCQECQVLQSIYIITVGDKLKQMHVLTARMPGNH